MAANPSEMNIVNDNHLSKVGLIPSIDARISQASY